MSLEEKYANDPGLLADYQKNLLEPGWAGELDRHEISYIKSCLRSSSSLRRKWGFKPSAKRFPERHIRAVARNGVRPIQRPVLDSYIEKEQPNKGSRPRKEEGLSQIDIKSSPKNRVNDPQRDAQVGTKDEGDSNQPRGPQQSEKTIFITTNPRDEAFNSLIKSTSISISEAIRLEVRDIDFKNENITILRSRERVKLSCPYCREAVRRHHRFCPACGGEINEPVREKIEQNHRRVIPLDTATIRSIKEYLKLRRSFPYDGPLLFPFTRQRGQQIMKRIKKLTELESLKQTHKTDNKKPEKGSENDTA